MPTYSPIYSTRNTIYSGPWAQMTRSNMADTRENEDRMRAVQGLPSLDAEASMLGLLPSQAMDPRLAGRLQGAGYNPAAAASLAGRMNTQNLVDRIRSAQDIINMIEALRQKYELKAQEIPQGSQQTAMLQGYFS